MVKKESNSNFALLAIVAIVAIVALVVLFNGGNKATYAQQDMENDNLAGEAKYYNPISQVDSGSDAATTCYKDSDCGPSTVDCTAGYSPCGGSSSLCKTGNRVCRDKQCLCECGTCGSGTVSYVN